MLFNQYLNESHPFNFKKYINVCDNIIISIKKYSGGLYSFNMEYVHDVFFVKIF